MSKTLIPPVVSNAGVSTLGAPRSLTLALLRNAVMRLAGCNQFRSRSPRYPSIGPRRFPKMASRRRGAARLEARMMACEVKNG